MSTLYGKQIAEPKNGVEIEMSVMNHYTETGELFDPVQELLLTFIYSPLFTWFPSSSFIPPLESPFPAPQKLFLHFCQLFCNIFGAIFHQFME